MEGGPGCLSRGSKPRGGMISRDEIKLAVRLDQFAVGQKKTGVAGDCLLEKCNSFRKVLPRRVTGKRSIDRFRAADVKIVGCDVPGWLFFNRLLFRRQNLGLQLRGDGFGYFALDGEDIGQIAIISLSPKMRVGSRIDELGVDANAIPPIVARCLPGDALR